MKTKCFVLPEKQNQIVQLFKFFFKDQYVAFQLRGIWPCKFCHFFAVVEPKTKYRICGGTLTERYVVYDSVLANQNSLEGPGDPTLQSQTFRVNAIVSWDLDREALLTGRMPMQTTSMGTKCFYGTRQTCAGLQTRRGKPAKSDYFQTRKMPRWLAALSDLCCALRLHNK